MAIFLNENGHKEAKRISAEKWFQYYDKNIEIK